MVAGAGAGCGGKRQAAATGDGTLVLEVGGAQASLREALVAAGQQPASPQLLRAMAATPPPAEGGDASAPVDSAAAAPPPTDGDAAAAQPTVQPTAAWFVVKLEPRQTLIHLAKKYLGDGNRFREILTLNGWSDADTRRLQAGQRVKIPRQAAAPR
jgi:nucleoid-associated protein YgaU